MGLDRIEQLVIRQGGILETQFGEGRALLPQQVAQRGAGLLRQPGDHGARRRGLEILDHMRLDPDVADQL